MGTRVGNRESVAAYLDPEVAQQLRDAASDEGVSVSKLAGRELAAAMARRSRALQGLPPTVADPGTLARIARILEASERG
jgi:hypothetical protein